MAGNLFFKLIFTRIISLIGDAIFMLGLPLFVYHHTKSEQSFGLSFGLEISTYMIFSFIGGHIADTLPLRKTLIIIDWVRFLLVLTFGIILNSHFNLHLCLILIILLASLSAVYNISFEKLPLIYLKAEEQSKTLSYFQSMNQAVHIVGAPLAGIIISFSSGGLIFYINAITFLIPMLAIYLFPRDNDHKYFENNNEYFKASRGLFIEMSKGLKNLWTIQQIRIATLLSVYLNMVLAIYYANWAVLFKSEMNLSDQLMGVPHGIGGFAFLMTTIFIGRRYGSNSKSWFYLLVFAQVIGLLAGLLIPFIDSIPYVIFVTTLFNISSAAHSMPSILIRKKFCKISEYGKVLGAAKMISRIFAPLAIATSVILLKWYSVKEILLWASIGAILLSIYPILYIIKTELMVKRP